MPRNYVFLGSAVTDEGRILCEDVPITATTARQAARQMIKRQARFMAPGERFRCVVVSTTKTYKFIWRPAQGTRSPFIMDLVSKKDRGHRVNKKIGMWISTLHC